MATKTEAPLVYTPVIKIVTIRADQSRAFSRFTSEMASWWPLPSHSVGGLDAETVVMRRGYPIGWAYVLGLYAGRRGPFMLAVTALTTALMWITRHRALAVRRDLA